jgi:hypothetical protein
MSIAPKLPTNVIKDTTIIFDTILLQSSTPLMCIEQNSTNKLYTNNCNYSNINQQYIYNPIKKQLKETNTNNCLDIDTNNNITWSPCDEYNVNQQYNYNMQTNQIINPNNKLCIDLSTSKLNTCNTNTSQQFFGIKSLNKIFGQITENNNTIIKLFNNATELYNRYLGYYNELDYLRNNNYRKYRIFPTLGKYEQLYLLYQKQRDLMNLIVIDISNNLPAITAAKDDSMSAVISATNIFNSNDLFDTKPIMMKKMYQRSDNSIYKANMFYNNISKYNDPSYKNNIYNSQ